jgi:predicted Zn-dependent peptidase
MHILLFTELRSKLSLLYDIEIYNETDSCGTSIFIEFDVRPTNVIPAMKHLFKYIRHMQTIKNSHLDGFKSREMYNYLAGNKSMIDYYSTFVFSKEPLHSKTQIIDQIKQISSEDILRLANSLLPIEEALCIYQSNRDLKLTWEKLI